jgi:hypothetical protein
MLKDSYYRLLQVDYCYYHYYYFCGNVSYIVFGGAMQHSKLAAKEEGTLHGRQTLRQYYNKRLQKKEIEMCTPTGTGKKVESSVFSVLPAEIDNSCSVRSPEPIKLKSSPDLKLSASQPQVIVRKFTLPPFSNAYAVPSRSKKNITFVKSTAVEPTYVKPKRWKQLCNLQHEMTTTLPMSRVMKMLSPSTSLTHEYCPGTLQSYAAGKLDVVNSTLQNLLSNKKVDLDSTSGKEEGSMSYALSPAKIKTVTAPEDTLFSKTDDDSAEERFDTTEEVPEVAAVAEVSSIGGSFDTVHNNVGIVGGKFVVFQPLSQTKHVIQQEGGNSKMNTIVLKSPQGANIDIRSGKKLIKPLVGHEEVMSSALKTMLVQGSVKPSSELGSKEHGIVQENLKLSSEPTMKEQNVVWRNVKHNSQSVTKEQNVAQANVKHKSECNMKQQNVVQGNLKHSSELAKNEQTVKHESVKNESEPANKEENVAHENLKHCLESSSKERSVVSCGNMKTTFERISKEQNIVPVHPVPQETNNLTVARDHLRDVLTVSLQTAGNVAPLQESAQSKNNQPVEPSDKPAEDASIELKQLKQLQLEFLMMKRRQNIAMQVERDVLRAKNVKLVQEVQLPARRVLLSETGTQTNLFSLVEPGRMVEMMISDDKTGKY